MKDSAYKKTEYYLYNYTKIDEIIENIKEDIIAYANVSGSAWLRARGFKATSNTVENQAIKIADSKRIKDLKKAVYIILGVDTEGIKQVLSIVVVENESAKMWLSILNDLKNRGVQDILILCSDGLTGIKDAINTAYPNTAYQRCIVHQIRNSLKYVKHDNKKELATDLKRVYTSSTAEQGYEVLLELEEKWSKKYPNAIRSWQDNWDSLSTFFQYSQELRTVMYTTNAIENLNSSYRRANRNRVVFPTNMALLKTLFLATKNIEKKWTVRHKNWDIILSQLSIMYPERI